MTGFFRCLRLDPDSDFWVDIPGESEFCDQIAAIHAAKAYYETSGQPARTVNQHSVILWDSFRDRKKPPQSKH